jgi:hypothetical protein
MFCGDCGERNPDTTLFCQACFGSLAYSQGRSFTVDENFDRLREAAQQVTSGAMGLPAFTRFLYSYRSIIREALNNIDSLVIHDRIYQQTFVQRHLMELGMHCFLEGIAVMEQFHGFNTDVLVRGLRIVEEGSLKLVESTLVATSSSEREEEEGGSFLDITV